MNITRKLLTFAGPLWLVTMSQLAAAQTAAPKAPAAAPAPKAVPVNAPTAKPAPAAPASAPAPATAPATTPAPAAAAGPAAPAAATTTTTTTTTAAATSAAPVATVDADAALPPPAPVALPPAPQPMVEPAPAAAPVADAPAENLPKKLAIGNSGFLQIGGLFQGWMVIDDNSREANDARFFFRVRRAQVKLSGDIVKDSFSYLVILDGAKTLSFNRIGAADAPTGYSPPSNGDTSLLLDFMVTAKSSIADVSIGQWKSPISYEGTTSSAELLFPERAYTTRYFGDNYDAGLRADKKFEYVKYSLQLLQGAPGPNQIDQNRQKELALRLEFTPMKGIMVGGAGLMTVGQRTSQGNPRDIVEADVAVDVSGLIARGELLWGWTGRTGDNAPDRVKSRGMAASFGYTIAKKVQPVARISYLDVDTTTLGTAASQPLMGKFSIPSDEVRGYELGVNYLIDGKFAKIQAAYGYFDLDNAPYRHQFILSGQASF